MLGRCWASVALLEIWLAWMMKICTSIVTAMRRIRCISRKKVHLLRGGSSVVRMNRVCNIGRRGSGRTDLLLVNSSLVRRRKIGR